MNTSIVLDQPGNASFTNLDPVSGKVVLRCSKSVDIDFIVVKLEGESRTRLLSSSGSRGEKPKPQLEYHKACPPFSSNMRDHTLNLPISKESHFGYILTPTKLRHTRKTNLRT